MSNNILIASSILALGIGLKLKQEKKKKRIWVKLWRRKYEQSGPYETLYREWAETDPDMYRTMLRLYPEDFKDLLMAIDPIIAKEDTLFRKAIPSDKRLAITLRFLVQGICSFNKYFIEIKILSNFILFQANLSNL